MTYFFAFFALVSLIQHIKSATYSYPVTYDATYSLRTNITLGSHGQNIQAILDTGSAQFISFCQLCQNNCDPQKIFKNKNSISFGSANCRAISTVKGLNSILINNCQYSCQANGYSLNQECYFTGSMGIPGNRVLSFIYQLVYDNFTLPGLSKSIRSSWGCIITGPKSMDNLIGLGPNPSYQLFNSLFLMDPSASRGFSICFKGKQALLTIGGISSNVRTLPIVVRINSTFSSWWSILNNQIGTITLGNTTLKTGTSLSFGPFGLVADTGTNFYVLPDSIVTGLIKQIQNICKLTFNKSGCVFSTLPIAYFTTQLNFTNPVSFFSGRTININLGNGTIRVPLQNFFWNIDTNLYRLAVISRQKQNIGSSVWAVQGFINFQYYFDFNQKSISIYPITSCSSLSSRNLQEENEQQSFSFQKIPKMINLNEQELINKAKMKYNI